MPKIGDVHPDDSDFVFVSIKNGELIYKDTAGRIMPASEVSARLIVKDEIEGEGEEE